VGSFERDGSARMGKGVIFDVAESEIELDGVGVEHKLDKARVNIARVEGEFTVEGVKGTLEDEVDVVQWSGGRTCYAWMYVPLVRVRRLILGLRSATKR
jgi:hypothetical protein